MHHYLIIFLLVWSSAAFSRTTSTFSVYPAQASDRPAFQYIESKHLVTRLSLTSVPGKRPLVLLLHGSDGRDSLLSGRLQTLKGTSETLVLRYPNLVDELLRRGYHVLGACYFDRDEKYSIPHDLINIRVESFVEEINKYTAAHADVIDADSIGVLGISKGGELSLLLASLYPIFKFVIPIVPSHVVFQGSSISLSHHSSWMLNGKELPFLPFANYSPKTWMCGLSYGAAMIGVISGTMVNCGPMHFASMQDEEALEEATIKVENINGPIFFVSAKEDQFWPSAALSDLAIERVNKRGFRHPVKNLAEPGDHFSYDNHWEIILDAMDAAAQYARDGDAAKCQQKFDEAVGHAST